MKTNKTSKKSLLLVVLALCIVLCTVMGTMAWLTSTDNVINSFTSGNIDEPKVPQDPTLDPNDPTNGDTANDLGGNILEPSWISTDEHKMLPGATFAKDPYVGIGPDSEDAYVFAWAKDETGVLEYEVNAPNGTDAGWVLVAGTADLYVWSDKDADPIALKAASVDATESVWTTVPLFSSVTVDTDATSITEGDMTVYCYIHQALSGDGTTDLYATAETAAITEYNK